MAIAPNGVAVVIETKTMTYERRHLALLHDQTAWLARAGEGGHAGAPLASCASSVRGASSGSSTTFWWCRSTA